MDVTTTNLLLAFAVMLLGGAVQGATGFGSGLVSVGLLATVLARGGGGEVGVRDASIIFCLPAWTVCLAMLLRLRRHVRWRRVWPMLLAVLAGIPLGVWFLVRADERTLEIVLGVVMLVAVVYNLIPHLARRPWHPLWVGVPCGLLGGALGGAFSTGGPPIVAYVSTQGFDRLRFAGTLQAIFMASTTFRLIELLRRGLLTPPRLACGAVGIAAILIGATLGLRVLRRISDRWFRWVVIAMLLVLGVRYLW